MGSQSCGTSLLTAGVTAATVAATVATTAVALPPHAPIASPIGGNGTTATRHGEFATNRSCPQPAHRARMNPHASTPHRRKAANSATTYPGSDRPPAGACPAKAAKRSRTSPWTMAIEAVAAEHAGAAIAVGPS
jgi:hypothetical protein